MASGLDDAARREGSNWAGRMRGPDAEALRPQFEAWLAADPYHAEIWRDLQRQWDQTKFVANTPTGRARDLSSVAVWYQRPGLLRTAVIAGLVAICAGTLTFWHAHQVAPVEPIALATRTGEVRIVALSDGSKVTLDAASSIRVSIDAAAREVRLVAGNARFDIKPDARREFAVLTSGGAAVRTNGALFDIRQTNDLTRVTAFRGQLSFQGKAAPIGMSTPAALAIRQGQQLDASPDGAMVTTSAPPPARDWTTGMLTFDGDRLGDAIAEFNRHNEQKIALADPALAQLRITGAFGSTDPGGFVRTIAAMLALAPGKRPDGALTLDRRK